MLASGRNMRFVKATTAEESTVCSRNNVFVVIKNNLTAKKL
jgi:hypothetical protein